MSTKTFAPLKDRLFLLFFFLAKIILEYSVVNSVYDLHRDEYLYLDQGNHLAWGYVSVPPFTSWIAYIIQHLGNGVFWVRFFPALFGTLTLILCWYIVAELGGGLRARIVTAIALICSVLARLDILFQPNAFDVLAWTAIYFLLICYVHRRENKWLIWTGIATGIAILNKYNVAFLLAGLLPAFLLTRERTIFRNRYLYYALCLALIIILPNLIWQLQNHLPVVHHMKELARTQLKNVDPKDFLLFQLLFFIGSITIIIAAFIGVVVYPPLKPYRFIALSYVCTILIFLYLQGKDYYTIGLYPVLIALGSAYLDEAFVKGWKRFLLPAFAIINVLIFIALFKFLFPVVTPEQIRADPEPYQKLGLLKWEDGKDHLLPQDFADMLAWKEMAAKTYNVYKELPDSEKNKTLVIADNYGEAGAINYYNHGKINAVSMNADYIRWFPKGPYTTIIAIKSKDAIIEPVYLQLFQSITFKDSVQNQWARERGTSIYLIKGVSPRFKEILDSAIQARINFTK
jgi:4-amino-4-deoxy-L-arabinose transferase-like glycosyltransferase